MSSQTNYKEKHAGRKRDPFPIVCIVIACVPLLFICSAILTIIAGGVTHVGEAVTAAVVLFSLRMSVVTSTISTTLCLLLALPTAYALTRTSMPFKRAAETLMQLTLSLPYILLGFALLLMFSSPAGKALKDIGFAVVFQPVGIVFAQLIVNLPFSIRMVRTAFGDVNPRMEFVAKTLGASSFETFRTIILPICRNSIISTFVLTWARGMGEFGATLMVAGSIPGKTQTLALAIYDAFQAGDDPLAISLVLLTSAICLSILVAADSFLSARIGKGARRKRKKAALPPSGPSPAAGRGGQA